MQRNIETSKKQQHKILRVIAAGIIGTLAFNVVMYADIAVTGIPLDITKALGSIAVGENGADFAGHIFHFANGVGLALIYRYIFLKISTRVTEKHLWLHGITFAVLVTVGPVWLGLLPALGAGVAGLGISPLVPLITILRHIAFGAVLGILMREK